MGKVKVLVLYPTGFAGLGIEVAGSDVVEVDEADAKTLVGAGWAELRQPDPKPEPKAAKSPKVSK